MKQSRKYQAYDSGYVLVPGFWAWVNGRESNYADEQSARKAWKRAIKAGATRARNRHAKEV